MAHALTETATFDPDVIVPDDGDGLNSASITAGIQALTNRTRYMVDTLSGARPLVQLHADAANWEFPGGSPTLTGYKQTSIVLSAIIWFAVSVPASGTLNAIRIYLHGDGGAVGPHANLPTLMPRIAAVIRMNSITGARTIVGPFIDSSPDVPSYETLHAVDSGPLAMALSDGDNIYVIIDGEGLADSLPDALCLVGLEADVSAT